MNCPTHLIDLNDVTVGQWNSIIKLAHDIMEAPMVYAGACRGKIMGTLFYEPSTRTQMSFQTAMLRLGGGIIGFDNPSTSSVAKGENLKDTTKIVSGYSDILVMRHPLEGSSTAAAISADCPVINAGDGGHAHPTQTLTDLLTIYREKGRLNDLTIGFCGDLKYGRTVHSLIAALSRYTGIRVVLISPLELMLPSYVRKDIMRKNGIPYVGTESLEDVLPNLDVLYMTRIQGERFESQEEYERLKDSYILTPEKMKNAKPDMCILHPLPRVNEISTKIDKDPRACYFKQVRNGKYIRMALILKLLEEAKRNPAVPEEDRTGLLVNKLICDNPRCITTVEQELDQLFEVSDAEAGTARCHYCENKMKF